MRHSHHAHRMLYRRLTVHMHACALQAAYPCADRRHGWTRCIETAGRHLAKLTPLTFKGVARDANTTFVDQEPRTWRARKRARERGGGVRGRSSPSAPPLCCSLRLVIIPAHLPNPRHPRECAVLEEFARVLAAALTANVLSSARRFRSATVTEADDCYMIFSSGCCTFRFLLSVASCFDIWFYTHTTTTTALPWRSQRWL